MVYFMVAQSGAVSEKCTKKLEQKCEKGRIAHYIVK